MRKGSGTTIGMIGAITVVFTMIAFFLSEIERSALHLWALAFLLLAEVVLCSGLIAVKSLDANHSKVLVRSGITGALSLYFFITLVSILFAGQFRDRVNIFIILELGIIALFAVIILMILACSRSIAGRNRRMNERDFLKDCELRVYNLLADSKNKEYKSALNVLYENLKYSDSIGSSTLDDKIAVQITLLEGVLSSYKNNRDDVLRIIDEASGNINQRKKEIGELKRGGF